VLDKTEQRFFGGTDAGPVVQAIQGALYQRGMATQQVGPAQWSGQATQTRWAMAPRATLWTYPAAGGFVVVAQVSAEFENNGLIVFALLWFFCFPAAVIVAVLAYQEWQKKQSELLFEIWGPVAEWMAAPMPPYGPGPPPVGPRRPG
jgi:hypothetical protein